MAEMDGGAHEREAIGRDPIAARALNLLDQTMGAQQLQQAADLAALAALLLGIAGGLEPQVLGHVAAVKAALAMFPAQDREEQALLRVAEGVECAFALA